MLQKIRKFFAERKVLEVETPILSQAIGTDPNLDFFTTHYQNTPNQRVFYLQTSPEFAMKRLLAAGSGSIYQICKAFRNGEAGRYHNPEFTLLEWYRVGFSLPHLMDEIEDLMAVIFDGKRSLQPAERISYQSLFRRFTGLNSLVYCYEEYLEYAQGCGLPDAAKLCGRNHADWLDFIFSQRVQPRLEKNKLYMVFDYPACMPSLAKINPKNTLVVERVELFLDGVELGNGYHELADAYEQDKRFDREVAFRKSKNRPKVAKDRRLLAALSAGLPDCSGMAIGLDRVLMLLANSTTIEEVLPFSIDRA